MFLLQYREFTAKSTPWSELTAGVGFDIGGYIGTESRFELEYTKATSQTIAVTELK